MKKTPQTDPPEQSDLQQTDNVQPGDDLERFRELAEETLRQTDGGYLIDELVRTVTWLLYGVIPLAGLLLFEWSAREWLLFLLIGAWSGIICDTIKLYFLYPQVMKTAEIAHRNNMVWAKVEQLRKGEKLVVRKKIKSDYKPMSGVLVDLVFGTVGTAMVLGLFPGDLFTGLVDSPTFVWSIAAFTGYRFLFMVRDILSAGSGPSVDRQVRVAVGLRGAGLFMLGFLVAFISGEDGTRDITADSAAWWVMVVVNGLSIAVSLLLIWAIFATAADSRWLRSYLSRSAEP